jgi:hypothetical protein
MERADAPFPRRRPQFTLMSAALMIGHHFSISAFW